MPAPRAGSLDSVMATLTIAIAIEQRTASTSAVGVAVEEAAGVAGPGVAEAGVAEVGVEESGVAEAGIETTRPGMC